MTLERAIKIGRENDKLHSKINDFLLGEKIDPLDDEHEYEFLFNLISAIN